MKNLLICLFCLALMSGASAGEPVAKAKGVAKANASAQAEPAASLVGAQASARSKRQADIDYWLKSYDGSEFASGEYRCQSPRFPAVSKGNDEIDRVGANMEAWQACHNKAVEHLNATPSFAKLIPADLTGLMTPEEMQQATERLQLVRDNIAENLRVSGKLVLADFTAWRDATEAWVKEHNDIVNRLPSEDRQRDIEARRQNYATPSGKR